MTTAGKSVVLTLLLLALRAASGLDDGTYVCKLDGSDVLRVAGPTQPAWLPDGKTLLLGAPNALYRAPVDGSPASLLVQDAHLAMTMGLTVSASGKLASASVVKTDGTGGVRIWNTADGAVVLDDQLYASARTDAEHRWLHAVTAWSPLADQLAWIPIDFAGFSARARSVKVFHGATNRFHTVYLDREAYSLCWHPGRGSLIVTSGASLLEIPEGRDAKVLIPRVADEGGGDTPLQWLPRHEVFYWGQSFYDGNGAIVPPEINTEGPLAKLCWTGSEGNNLVLAASVEADNGGCSCDLWQGKLGDSLKTFHRLCRLPTTPQAVYLSGDGARVAFVVGGYVLD
jgi:hypothetical protein